MTTYAIENEGVAAKVDEVAAGAGMDPSAVVERVLALCEVAAGAGMDPSAVVERVLALCVELRLLESAVCKGPECEETWGVYRRTGED